MEEAFPVQKGTQYEPNEKCCHRKGTQKTTPLVVPSTTLLPAGSISRVAEQIVLCAALKRGTVLVAVFMGALAHLSMPAISGLVSKNSELHEQARLAALVNLLSKVAL